MLVKVCRYAQAQQPDFVEHANLPSKHAILPNPYALFLSQRYLFFQRQNPSQLNQYFSVTEEPRVIQRVP